MGKGTSSLFLLHFVLILCNSATSSDIPSAKDSSVVEKRELRMGKQIYISVHRRLIDYFHYKTTGFDSIDPPTTTLPTTPISNPVTAPALTLSPGNSAPAIVTVPGTNPVGISSPDQTTNNPGGTPMNTPSTVTNPVRTPSTNPQAQPVGNPVTVNPPSFGGGASPVIPLPAGGNAQVGQGQSWCIAKAGVSQAQLQLALDYACGIGGADCSMIQQGASCYNPVSLQNHASYAFNSYYQKNPLPTSCDFGGAAVLTNINPSTGSCVYPSSSSSSSSPATTAPPTTQSPVNPTTTSTPPATQSPVNPTTSTPPTTQSPVNPTTTSTPTAPSSSGSTVPGSMQPPPGFSLGNPDPGAGFAASPPMLDNAIPSTSNVLQPFIGYLLIITSVSMGRLVLRL